MNPDVIESVYEFCRELIPSDFDVRTYQVLTIAFVLGTFYMLYLLIKWMIDTFGG